MIFAMIERHGGFDRFNEVIAQLLRSCLSDMARQRALVIDSPELLAMARQYTGGSAKKYGLDVIRESRVFPHDAIEKARIASPDNSSLFSARKTFGRRKLRGSQATLDNEVAVPQFLANLLPPDMAQTVEDLENLTLKVEEGGVTEESDDDDLDDCIDGSEPDVTTEDKGQPPPE